MTCIYQTVGQHARSLALLVVAIFCAAVFAHATDELSDGDVNARSKLELEALAGRIKAKIEATRPRDRTSEAFAPELEAFDALLLQYDGRAEEEALAQILYRKATLYHHILKEHDLAIATMEELCARFPDTERREAAVKAIELIESEARAAAIRKRLIPGSSFPVFEATDLSGDSVSLDSRRGSVALIHFWSSECDHCQSEMAIIKAAYQNFRDRGFSIIGISVDENRSELQSYLSENGIDWPQAFDGKGWRSDLIVKYGVKSIPETYLIDEEGLIIARNLPLDSLPSFLDQYLEN